MIHLKISMVSIYIQLKGVDARKLHVRTWKHVSPHHFFFLFFHYLLCRSASENGQCDLSKLLPSVFSWIEKYSQLNR